MLKFLALSNGKVVKNVTAKDAKRFLSEKKMLWVDMERGSNGDFDFVKKTFDIHPLTLEDMKSTNSLPKLDSLHENYTFVIFYRIYYDKRAKKVKTEEIDFCIGKNFIITVHIPKIKSVDDLRDKILKGVTKNGSPDFVLHGVLDKEVDDYTQLMNDLNDEIELMEDKLVKGRVGKKVLQELSHHRHEMAVLRRVVGPQREIINALSRGDSPYVSRHMLPYFRDIFDHIYRFYSSLEAHRELVASTFETYTSVQSNSTNQVIKQLTIIATIFLPLTFVTGVYGMNFRVLPEVDYEYGYFLVIAGMLILGLWMWIYLKRHY